MHNKSNNKESKRKHQFQNRFQNKQNRIKSWKQIQRPQWIRIRPLCLKIRNWRAIRKKRKRRVDAVDILVLSYFLLSYHFLKIYLFIINCCKNMASMAMKISPNFLKGVWGNNYKGMLGMTFAPGRYKPSQP